MELPEHLKSIIVELTSKVVVIEKHTTDSETYQTLVDSYYELIKQGFEHREFRTCPVYFKFFDTEDEYTHKLELRHFIPNLIMWKPLVTLDKYSMISEMYIVDCSKMSQSLVKGYIDNRIIIPLRKEINNRRMNSIIHDLIHELSIISRDFNIILGLSMNVETFIDIAKKNPRFNEIIRTKIDDNMQPKEIESYLDSLMDEQMEILKTEDNFLRPMLKSGTGVKPKQLAEFAINGGLKPDLYDNTIPIPINTNFIVGGLSNIPNYFLDAVGGRKAAIMNKQVMGKSGHFSRMIMLLATDIKLARGKKAKDCGTVYSASMMVRSKYHLQKLIGRYYRLPNVREYKVLQGDEKFLIGKVIYIRTPTYCAGKNVCRKCYGELYHTNIDLESAGGYAGTQITNPLSQSILSSKHLLTTQSETIEFIEDFYKFFAIQQNEIVLNSENEDVDMSHYSMLILKDAVNRIEQFEDSEYNSYITSFGIKHNKSGVVIEIKEASDGELYIHDDLKAIMNRDRGDDDYYEIDLNKIAFDDTLFAMEVANNELTKPLYGIMRLLNKKEHEGCETIDEMVQMMLDLTIESGFKADSVHGEMLIRALIRSGDDILETPNFGRYQQGSNYRILTVDAALKNHPSPLISISYQDLGKQLINPVTYRKTASSFINPYFM